MNLGKGPGRRAPPPPSKIEGSVLTFLKLMSKKKSSYSPLVEKEVFLISAKVVAV